MAIDWLSVEAPNWTRGRSAKGAHDESVPAVDPYLVWAEVTGFVDLELDPSDTLRQLPVILELKEPAAAFAQRCKDAKWEWIRIPSVYRCAPEWLKQATFCTATVTRQAPGKLVGELKAYVRRVQLGIPVFSETDVESDTQEDEFDAHDHPCLTGKSGAASPGSLPVLIGVIDEGLAFAHERFREVVGERPASRIEYFWNQNGGSAGSIRKCRVRGVDYGTEFSRPAIGQMLEQAKHAEQIDEDAVYRAARHRTVARRTLHGTHVMDLACGEAPGDVTADSPRMVCVELPKQTVRDTSGLSLAVHALDGIRYILDRAERISRGLRGSGSQASCQVVVNLSFGNIAGPHDGSSMLEAATDELIRLAEGGVDRPSLQVVIPAGNNHLSRCHARIELGAGDEETLAWRILPDDATPSFLEIWIDASDEGREVAVEVVPPGGPGSGWIRENQVLAGQLGGEAVSTVVYLDRVATGNGRMILVAVAPTATTRPTRSVAPAGNWQVRIRNESRTGKEATRRKSVVTINAWIQRDDTPIGFPRRGRQSRFEDERYIRFDSQGRLKEEDDAASIIKRAGTINAIGTGMRTIVIGGYRKRDGAPAAYSACGEASPSSRPSKSRRIGPDAMAISERSARRHGVLGGGGRSGSRVAMRGTSVAAPQVTRLIATQFSEGAFPDRKSVIKLAQQSDLNSLRKPRTGKKPRPPEVRAGGGRLGLLGQDED